LSLAVVALEVLLSVDSEGEEGANGSCEYTLVEIHTINAVAINDTKTANITTVGFIVA
jgi:hypothetical protein